MAERIEILKDKLLIVEGSSDEGFFRAFFNSLKISDVQIINIGGKSEFGNRIKGLNKIEGFRSIKKLGFFRDADSDPSTAFKSVIKYLKDNNINFPEEANTFSDHTDLSVGVFILPDSNSTGELEDLILKTIKGDQREVCIESFFRCIDKDNEFCSKAKVYTLLASFGYTKNDTINNLSSAAQKGYIKFNHDAFKEVTHFLEYFNT